MSASILASMADDMHCLHATERQAGESCTQFRARMLAEPDSHCYSCNCRTALEAALQEAEAWEVIHAWRQRSDAHSYCAGFVIDEGYLIDEGYYFALWAREYITEFHGGTRLEALRLAAAWCRAELAK